jgi:hypothetical protein
LTDRPSNSCDPRIVGAVHHGLVSGALAQLGSAIEVEGLDAFVELNVCVARLGRRTSGAA